MTLRRLFLVLALVVVASLLANPASAICKNCSYSVYGCTGSASQGGYTKCVSYQDANGNWTCDFDGDCSGVGDGGVTCTTTEGSVSCHIIYPWGYWQCDYTPGQTTCTGGGFGSCPECPKWY